MKRKRKRKRRRRQGWTERTEGLRGNGGVVGGGGGGGGGIIITMVGRRFLSPRAKGHFIKKDSFQ